MDKKDSKNNIGLIISIVGIVLIIGALIYAFVGTDMFKSNGKENNEENTENNGNGNNGNDSIDYNGVYKLDDVVIRVYKSKAIDLDTFTKDSTVYYSIEDNYSGYLEMTGNKGVSEIFDDVIEFVFNKDSVDVTFNESALESNEAFKNGTYKKTSDYGVKDYYKDNIGELEYFDSEYNGIYEYNGNKLYAFQIHENEINVIVIGSVNSSISVYGRMYEINTETPSVLTPTYNDDDEVSNITFDGDTLKFVNSKYEDISGEYTRTGKVSYDDAIALY